MGKMTDSHQTQLSAACLLLSVAQADELLDDEELHIIEVILTDFFSIDVNNSKELVQKALKKMKNATGIFEFGQHLNTVFDKDDKLDFITCIFEVAYADGDLHYLEHHTVKKIANILHVNREDILVSKVDMEKYLDL